LTPEARTTLATTLVEAEGQVKNATVQVDAATIALNRARKLLAEEAGSRRAVDEAQAVFDLAQKTLEAAQGRRDLIARALREGEADGLPPLPLVAPDDGLLRNVNASPGQNVPAGAALFELIDLAVMWVRVPVFVGELSEIDPDRDAAVGELVPRPGSARREARPMEAPPSADPLSTTADLFYRLDNRDGLFRPGQRVGISLALAGSDEGLVLPCRAIFYDIHGNSWVYVRTAARTYVRQRVLVREVVGELALLSEGPPEKAQVVTGGAAELFGTEMGFAK